MRHLVTPGCLLLALSWPDPPETTLVTFSESVTTRHNMLHVTCHMSQQPEIYSPTTSFTLSTEGCEWCDGWCDRHGSSMVKKCQVIQYIKQISSNYYIQWLSMTHSWSTDINSISIVLMLPGRSGHKGQAQREKRAPFRLLTRMARCSGLL